MYKKKEIQENVFIKVAAKLQNTLERILLELS